MTKPIVLIKISRLNTPKDLAHINKMLLDHTMSEDYHLLVCPVLDNMDVTIGIHNDSEATETTVEELKKHVEELINKTK